MIDSSVTATTNDEGDKNINLEDKEEEKKEEIITKITSEKDNDGDCIDTGIVDNSCRNESKTSILDKAIWKYLIGLLYILGISWFLCHPIVSIITGELKCRGIYIDEAQLDTQFQRPFLSNNPYWESNNSYNEKVSQYSLSLCQKISSLGKDDIFNDDNISCHSHLNQIDVARLTPHQNQFVPTDALVLVIPSSITNDPWNDLFLLLMQQLSTKSWLKKTILLVSPQTATFSLKSTVETFLNAYLGESNRNNNFGADEISAPLPPSYTRYMIRQLFVFDFTTTSHTNHHSEAPLVEILPQGRRGVLPNLDLVFAATNAFSDIDNKFPQKQILVTHPLSNHPTFQRFRKQILSALKQHLPASAQIHWWHSWSEGFCNIIAFMTSLVLGPFLPHDAALQRGIDSLTLRIQINHHVKNEIPSLVMSDIEMLIRSLSGLTERLHHSTTLYLMPAANKFVSNGEYIYPAILLLLPLLIRVVLLILRDMKSYNQIKSILFLLIMMMGLSAVLLITNTMIMTRKKPTGYQQHSQSSSNSLVMNLILVLSYGIIIRHTRCNLPKDNVEQQRFNVEKKKGIQALACLLAIYCHVPLIIAHISLAYPSCLLWSILLAHSFFDNSLFKIIGVFQVIISWPGLLATHIFSSFTPYVCLVFIPLHLLLTLMLTT